MKSRTETTGTYRSTWRGKAVAGGLVAAGVIIVAAIYSMPTPSNTPPPVEAVPVNVTVQAVEPVLEMADTFSLTGVVQPRAVVQVAAEVAARIEAYGTRKTEVRTPTGVLEVGSPIVEGQPITAGDPLVILNRDLLQARHDQAAAQHEHDEQEYQRILGLFERGTAPATELRQARTSRDVSRAVLDEAARSLARATIAAPMSGILNDWRMELGEYASPGNPVAEIVDIEQVKVRVDVPERDVNYLRVGQRAEIIPLGREPETVIGKITYINALADQATRTTGIELTVENRITATNPAAAAPAAPSAGDTGRQAARGTSAGGTSAGGTSAGGTSAGGTSAPAGKEYHLRSGQIVKVRLTRRVLDDVIMVPLASVIPLEHGKEVYVVRMGKAERRPVELGFIRGRSVQAVSGLQPGELLIVAGHRLVSPGQPVKVIESQPAEGVVVRAGDTGGQAASGTKTGGTGGQAASGTKAGGTGGQAASGTKAGGTGGQAASGTKAGGTGGQAASGTKAGGTGGQAGTAASGRIGQAGADRGGNTR